MRRAWRSGPELPAAFCADAALLAQLQRQGERRADPLWPLPLWAGYDEELSSRVADLNNVSGSAIRRRRSSPRCSSPLRDAIRRAGCTWISTAGIRKERPGRPVGGEAQCVRALYGLIRATLRMTPRTSTPSSLVEAMYRRESVSWALIGVHARAGGGRHGRRAGQEGLCGPGPPRAVNLAVAFVSGAPALSNVVSFLWANLAHGRARVRLMVWLLAAICGAGRAHCACAARARAGSCSWCCR